MTHGAKHAFRGGCLAIAAALVLPAGCGGGSTPDTAGPASGTPSTALPDAGPNAETLSVTLTHADIRRPSNGATVPVDTTAITSGALSVGE